MNRRPGIAIYFFVAVIVALALAMIGRVTAQDWRTASQEPVGLAPDPAMTPEPVVQVYAARGSRSSRLRRRNTRCMK